MKELSLHILDIAQNSIKANAKNIEVAVEESKTKNEMVISITDDGDGMSKEFLASVRDPFTTTRTTRRVGMGISLFEAAATQTGGFLEIDSTEGEGTTISAHFALDSIDRAPLGDMPGTMSILIQGSPKLDFVYRHKVDDEEFEFDTKQIRELLGDVPLDTPDVLEWIRGYIEQTNL